MATPHDADQHYTAAQFCKNETHQHIATVIRNLALVSGELSRRAVEHDASKFDDEEFQAFVEYTPKLRGCTYGSDQYRAFLAGLQPALQHHYAENRHHPEHFKNGVDGMTLIDVLEMLCDWQAATQRHADGDITKSIDINAKRFNLSPQLVSILHNTAEWLKERLAA